MASSAYRNRYMEDFNILKLDVLRVGTAAVNFILFICVI